MECPNNNRCVLFPQNKGKHSVMQQAMMENAELMKGLTKMTAQYNSQQRSFGIDDLMSRMRLGKLTLSAVNAITA